LVLFLRDYAASNELLTLLTRAVRKCVAASDDDWAVFCLLSFQKVVFGFVGVCLSLDR
jgi:hypothetical protein